MSDSTLYRLRLREGERKRSVWCRVRLDRDTGISERAFPAGHPVLRRIQRSHAGRAFEVVPAESVQQGGSPVGVSTDGTPPPTPAPPPPGPAGLPLPTEADDAAKVAAEEAADLEACLDDSRAAPPAARETERPKSVAPTYQGRKYPPARKAKG